MIRKATLTGGSWPCGYLACPLCRGLWAEFAGLPTLILHVLYSPDGKSTSAMIEICA